MNYFIYMQLPVVAPNQFTTEDLTFITPRVLELTYTSHSMRPWAEDLGHTGAPFAFLITHNPQPRPGRYGRSVSEGRWRARNDGQSSRKGRHAGA